MAGTLSLIRITGVSTVVVGAELRNWVFQEVMRDDVPWRNEVVDGGVEIVDGHVVPPTRPGIGIEVDEAAAAAYPYAPEPPPTWM